MSRPGLSPARRIAKVAEIGGMPMLVQLALGSVLMLLSIVIAGASSPASVTVVATTR